MPVIDGKYYDTNDTSWWDDLIDKISPNQPAPPAPTAPSPPAPITPGTAQNDLATAQDEELNDLRNRPVFDDQGNLKTSYCNIATVNTIKGVGGPVDDLTDAKGNPVLANQAAVNLFESNQRREVPPDVGQGLANQGKVVIGVQANPGGDGHMATVQS